MALSQSVEQSLDEASAALRNALAYAARGERPVVCNAISELLCRIDNMKSFDGILDKLDEMKLDRD
jgi:gamma-glutamyl phosphate reductase